MVVAIAEFGLRGSRTDHDPLCFSDRLSRRKVFQLEHKLTTMPTNQAWSEGGTIQIRGKSHQRQVVAVCLFKQIASEGV